MKILIFVVFAISLAYGYGVFVPPRHHRQQQVQQQHPQHLLGSKECTWGPSYWCQNLTAAADCRAVKHCIQTVWVHKQLPPDTGEICQTCLKMVKEARDQLESNETQELIKEVFEGSCALIHLKPVVKECDKIADQYIPELIDTLASEMNPQVVCSVAGLCNNEKLNQLVEAEMENNMEEKLENSPVYQCQTVIPLIESNFRKASQEEVRNSLLELCRGLSSFSDYCSNIIIKHFNEIYEHLDRNLNADEVCRLFTPFPKQSVSDVEIIPGSKIGYVDVPLKDDLPCELCEQLVGHLRDLLTANTTEEEFKMVLEGLCKQTKSFKNECLELTDQYYEVIYRFLTTELNSSTVCIAAGICPREAGYVVPQLMPILPSETYSTMEITPSASTIRPTVGVVNIPNEASNVRIIQNPESMQLPIERIMPPHTQEMYDSEVCVLCEYVLHYLQQVITNPTTEEEVKEALDHVCSKLPSSVNQTCLEFIDTYGDAVVALLAQEVDPSQICPLIKACPASNRDVEVFMQHQSDSKCPLCLFAVTKLEEMVKDKKTEDNIQQALNHLCDKLSNNLAAECNDFVNTYTNELIEMLLADLTPQEVCVYLKLCTDKKPAGAVTSRPTTNIYNYIGDIETNMIPDNTINGIPVDDKEEVEAGPQCVMCEFIMKEIEDQLKDKTNEQDIEKIVHSICNVMPGSISKECNDFVNQYGDTIIQLLIQALEPSEICYMMKMCPPSGIGMDDVRGEVLECAVCESLTTAMEKILDNPRVDHNMRHVLEKACLALPPDDFNMCRNMIENYGSTIYNWVVSHADKHYVCKHIGLCSQEVARPVEQLVGTNKCSRGPSYWCISEQTARECGEAAEQHCKENIWNKQNK